MARATSSFFHDTSYDPFLFAAIGEERNGMLLSVLSALARLDIDPWREAESLSNLPVPAATQRLTSLLSTLPSSQLKTPTPGTIMRLVGLLPRAAREETRSYGATAVARSNISWPVAICFILVFTMMFAQQFSLRQEPRALTGAGAPPVASPVDPGAAKARRD